MTHRRKRIKIVNKTRFTIFCTVVALLLMGSFATVFGNNHAAASDCEYKLIYVGTGDTLWSIADDNYSEEVDIRSAIRDIKYINGMTSNTIYPGDAIYIPVY